MNKRQRNQTSVSLMANNKKPQRCSDSLDLYGTFGEELQCILSDGHDGAHVVHEVTEDGCRKFTFTGWNDVCPARTRDGVSCHLEDKHIGPCVFTEPWGDE